MIIVLNFWAVVSYNNSVKIPYDILYSNILKVVGGLHA